LRRSENLRLSDKEHCKLVATQPCVVCGRTPIEAHHIRFARPPSVGIAGARAIVSPLICELMGKCEDGHGPFRSGAASAGLRAALAGEEGASSCISFSAIKVARLRTPFRLPAGLPD
jgi:hypothetical protein